MKFAKVTQGDDSVHCVNKWIKTNRKQTAEGLDKYLHDIFRLKFSSLFV